MDDFMANDRATPVRDISIKLFSALGEILSEWKYFQ
jgi:hypothetical protein